MNNRRKLLFGLTLGAAALPAFAAGKSAGKLAQKEGAKKRVGANPPTQARGGDYFPNILVRSHTGREFRLYDDMVAGNKVVLVNFISTHDEEIFPATQHVARIADRLGDKLGRDVFIYSISMAPSHDIPSKLYAHAVSNNANRYGWQFITAASLDDVKAVSSRLFKHNEPSPVPGGHVAHPARLAHYGNPSAGLWAAFAVDTEPGFAVERMSWVTSGAVASGTPQRAGPHPVAGRSAGHNRIA